MIDGSLELIDKNKDGYVDWREYREYEKGN